MIYEFYFRKIGSKDVHVSVCEEAETAIEALNKIRETYSVLEWKFIKLADMFDGK
jgi:hypothetical protein